MNDTERGQISTSAAEVYEEFFLPALFQEWTDPVADAAQISSGQRVLDVACGTGVLARAIARRVGPTGSVVGLDVNEGMLAVAKRKAPSIEWRHGRAEALPFESGSFDAVVSQFALMFFEDKVEALIEMMRVLRSGAWLAIAVWDTVENTPGYKAMANLLEDLYGPHAAEALRAPFTLGAHLELRQLWEEAGIFQATLQTRHGTARFPSLSSWIHTEIKGWTLADVIDDAQFARLQRAAPAALRSFILPDGRVEFAAPAHIIAAQKSTKLGS